MPAAARALEFLILNPEASKQIGEAAFHLVTHGGYPGAVVFWNDPARWQTYMRDSIIGPAIGRDILHLEKIRKPALLRQVFAIAAAHPSEILSLEKIAGLLAEKGAIETISHYLDLLHEAFLVTPLQKFAQSEIRRRRSSPKLVVKTGRYSAEDLRGLGHASKKFPECRPIVLCDQGCECIAEAAGFEAYSWVDFLL